VDLIGRYSKRAEWIDIALTCKNAATRRSTRTPERSFTPPKRIPNAQADALAQEYLDGATVYEIGRRHGIHRNTVAHHLHRLDIPMRRHGLSGEQARLAAHLYQNGQSLARIGERLAVDPSTVRAVLLAQGVPTRAPHGNPQ
jgi:hypothetical protein